jgi:hypothetical protein
MRVLLHLASRLYPGAWRKRYGVEFQILLDDITPRWRDVVDVLAGGLQMHVKRAHPALTAAVFSIAGALVAGAVASTTADRFTSSGTMTVRRAGPSTAPETARLEDVMPRLAREAFRRDILTGIVDQHDLYRGERTRLSSEGIANRLRGDIGIQRVSPSVFRVSFASSDGRQAQAVARELMRQLVDSNFQSKGGGSGAIVQVIEPPDEPTASVNPRRVARTGAAGFGGGALLGTLIGFFRRRDIRA